MSQQPPIIHRVESDHEALKALHVLGQAPQLGFDTETTGLDPLKARLRLVTLAPSEHESYVFDTWALRRDGKKALQSFFETYKNPLLAHNGKFDCKFVRAHLGVHKFNEIVDTMLAHQVSSCGNLDEGFGLQDSAWQFLREQVNKAEQTSDWGRANLTDIQWEYAGSDATILHPLWAEIEQKLLGQNQRHVAQLEFDIVDAMALLELNGILLDRDRWMDIYNLASADWERLRAELQELLLGANKKPQQALFEYAPSRIINPNSYDQLIPALQAMGIPLPIDDDTGHPTTRNFKIEPLALKYYVIEVLLARCFADAS
jgi:DNA polymerase-1